MDSSSSRRDAGFNSTHKQISLATLTLGNDPHGTSYSNTSPPPHDPDIDTTEPTFTHKQAYRLPSRVDDLNKIKHSSPPDAYRTIIQESSPQILFKPARCTPPRENATTDYKTPSPNLGAVARLAIDGGLTTEQLFSIGHHAAGYRSLTPSCDADQSVCQTEVRFRHGATSSLTHCVSRPAQQQPVPHCTTYQPIRLVHRFRSPTDPRRHPTPVNFMRSPSSVPYRHQQPIRRDSFPLQMTRVGGLVLQSSPSCANEQNRHCPTYQSLSARASPSVPKTMANAFFPLSASQTPSSMTPPSGSASGVEIVRFGPGDTVTHALSTDVTYTATALIRMHDCPQPYVAMPGSEELNATCNSETQRRFDPSASAERNHSKDVRYLIVSAPPTTERSQSPDYQSPVQFTSPQCQLDTKPRVFTSPTGTTQVVRTMRHLRRMRHILGDSLSCPISASSASTGALSQGDHLSPPVSSNSLVELRNEGSHSVDSVRPASYTCKCGADYSDLLSSPPSRKLKSNEGLARFCTSSNENWTTWKVYHLKLLDDTLALSRVLPDPNMISSATEPPPHVHISLTTDHISWHPPEDRYPDWRSHVPKHFGASHHFVMLASHSRDPPMAEAYADCQILMDKKTAVRLMGNSEFAPKHWDAITSNLKTTFRPHKSRSRERSNSARSSSLGLAGPPGGLPLFRAASTAAASVGVSLLDRLELSPQIRKTKESSMPESSSTPLEDYPIDPVNGSVKKSTKFASEYPSQLESSSDQVSSKPRLGRGRLHQALSRMRRAATASSEATSRSLSNAATSTRRFASTHGLFSKSNTTTNHTSTPIESDVVSSPCVPSAPRENLTSYHLATSVSPDVALQTQCMTYLPYDSVVEGDSSHSNLEADSPTGEKPASEQEASPAPDDSKPQAPILTSSFVPLPLSASGPLPLHKCPRSTLSPFVPFIVELCVTLVERFGLNCVGLYRLSGSKTAHDFITTELRKTISEIDVNSDKWNDIHAVCGVLKTFLRNLPDSLFPKVMYADFLAACKIPQREKRLLSIQRLLSIMECYPNHPEYRAHRATLRYLATHLARVSARETVNKMTSYNLALVFAPNLVQPCEDTPELLMTDSKFKIMLVEIVIKYHSWIFSPDLGLESGCSIPTDSVEDLVSAVAQSEVTGDTAGAQTTAISGGPLVPTCSQESEDPVAEFDRLDGDMQLLVGELFRAAANLPPPPSDTDLETAEEPGPSSDRPSDVTVPIPRPRFTSIPVETWSSTSLRGLDSNEGGRFRPELIFTKETDADAVSDPGESDHSDDSDPPMLPSPQSRLISVHLGAKLDNLRHLSQGCLDQYTHEARQLGARVAESRRQLELTRAQRLHAEQLLQEARSAHLAASVDQTGPKEQPDYASDISASKSENDSKEC